LSVSSAERSATSCSTRERSSGRSLFFHIAIPHFACVYISAWKMATDSWHRLITGVLRVPGHYNSESTK
jgi:hypothetical protein